MKSYKILSFLFLISLTFNNFLEAERIPLEKLLCGGETSGGT